LKHEENPAIPNHANYETKPTSAAFSIDDSNGVATNSVATSNEPAVDKLSSRGNLVAVIRSESKNPRL
jgi:hypothetical protein